MANSKYSFEGTETSGDYHDYVFKDGRLLGQFDEMYRNSKEVPWLQDKTANKLFVDLDISIIKHFLTQFNISSICDLGCGLGYVTSRLHKELLPLVSNLNITGIDVSIEAINQAKMIHPDINFIQANLAIQKLDHIKFDLIYMKDVLWYICNEVDDFILSAKEMLNPGGVIYVMQSVPDKEVFVGSELFPTTFAISSFLEKSFEPVYVSSTYEPTKQEERKINTCDS